MNERIQELKNQTLDRHFSRTWTTMDYDDVTRFAEGFAELIVRECIDTVQTFRTRMDASNDNIVVALKDHFGVEE